jgi:hypothetical protein
VENLVRIVKQWRSLLHDRLVTWKLGT